MTATWEELAALGITGALDGGEVLVDGVEWAADVWDADGDLLPPGQLYLTLEAAGGQTGDRTVLVQVTVTIVEGAPS